MNSNKGVQFNISNIDQAYDYLIVYYTRSYADILGNRVTSVYRIEKKFRQEDLAEKAELSPNYIGMIERGEKTPSLETLVAILNALNISADMVLCDVLQTGYQVKSSVLNEKISELSEEDQSRIFDVVDVLIQHSKSSFSVKQQ